jgi:hypothetical protein
MPNPRFLDPSHAKPIPLGKKHSQHSKKVEMEDGPDDLAPRLIDANFKYGDSKWEDEKAHTQYMNKKIMF